MLAKILIPLVGIYEEKKMGLSLIYLKKVTVYLLLTCDVVHSELHSPCTIKSLAPGGMIMYGDTRCPTSKIPESYLLAVLV